MRVRQLTMVLAMAALTLMGTACGSKQKNAEQAATEQVAAMEIDALLEKAPELVDQEVTISGVCTHTCAHGATKIFLMGSDDTKTIRVNACELGSFDTKCVNNIVEVKGILKEERIDEAYLVAWEEREKSGEGEKHGEGNGEQGCDTEKKSRGETANTFADRMADFRAKIAAEQAKTGKAYLSFYHIDAISYEIK